MKMNLPENSTIMNTYIILEHCLATNAEKGRNVNLILGEQNLFQNFNLPETKNPLVTDECLRYSLSVFAGSYSFTTFCCNNGVWNKLR